MEATREPAAAVDEAAALSCDELREDLTGALALVRAQRLRIAAFRRALRAQAVQLHPAAEQCVLPLLDPVDAQYGALCSALQAALRRSGRSPAAAMALRADKHEALERLRSLQGVAAALMVCVERQSPSADHSRWSQAGTLTGRITLTKNDYMRDHHGFADVYEQAWAAAYVDAQPQQRVHAFATSSGMAAFALAATRLCGDSGEVLAGEGSWFQNKMLLDRLFAGRVRYVDEHDTTGILAAVRARRPRAVFLDTLCNAATQAMPDLAALLPALDEAADRATTVVLDNTCLSAAFQPLLHMPARPRNLRLVVVESLNKYHQFGADRVTGGMLWTTDPAAEDLFYLRMILGANIADASVHALPAPDRSRHAARMRRIGRNARRLVQHLQARIDAEPAGACEKVVHASLPAHPAHGWASRLPFQGGSLVLVLRPRYRLVEAYQRFLALALDEARDAGVDLIVGSSFGFDTTRLYLTTPFAGPFSEPYLRISAGTESMLELQRLGEVLVRTMQRMARLKPSDFASDAVSRAVMQWDSLRKAPLGKWHGATAN